MGQESQVPAAAARGSAGSWHVHEHEDRDWAHMSTWKRVWVGECVPRARTGWK